MNEIRSKSGLAIVLSRLEGFKIPKVRAEQYTTDSEIAADALWKGLYLGDIRQKVIADLGCGTGILGIGALLLGAKQVYFVDNDKEAIEMTETNIKNAKSEDFSYELINKDVNEVVIKADVVIMNPPFGVKKRHADRAFLETAFELGTIVYCFSKSENKGFIDAFARDNSFKVSHIWNYDFPLKQTLSYHKRKIYRLKVSCFRMEKEKISN